MARGSTADKGKVEDTMFKINVSTGIVVSQSATYDNCSLYGILLVSHNICCISKPGPCNKLGKAAEYGLNPWAPVPTWET